MRIIIHDLDKLDSVKENDIVINSCSKHCVGCFSCWIKHPMQCIFHDELQDLSRILLESDTLIIISKCICGCYSSKVKKILERIIGYVKPYFVIRNKEIHHESRQTKKLNFIVYFYGDMDETTKVIAKNLVYANMKNLNTGVPDIHFIKNPEELGDFI